LDLGWHPEEARVPFFHLVLPLKLTLSLDGGCGFSKVALKLKSAFAFDKHFEQFEGIGRLP